MQISTHIEWNTIDDEWHVKDNKSHIVIDYEFFQVTEDELSALRIKLKETLGEGYEVETHKEVSALMGVVRELFDVVIFYHDDAICGRNIKRGLIQYLLSLDLVLRN